MPLSRAVVELLHELRSLAVKLLDEFRPEIVMGKRLCYRAVSKITVNTAVRALRDRFPAAEGKDSTNSCLWENRR